MINGTLICLIILTSQCVCVHSKVIIVNSNNGNDNTECCVNGECACSSLSTALLNIDNNTIINITSQSVALNNTTTMGSGKLTNITITGSNVTIMCNNSGSVYCESCDDVMIEGITWDRCGDPNGANIAGVTFNGTINISLVNCTFQHSQLTAVSLLQVSDNILIQSCNFSSNIPFNNPGVLAINRVLSHGFSDTSNITVIITEGYFYNNTYNGIPPVNIHIDDNSVANCNITFKKSTFISNQITFLLHVKILKLINILLTEISVFNNSHHFGRGACINLFSTTGDAFLSIISSNFKGNHGSNVHCLIEGNTSVVIENSNFTDSGKPKGTEKIPTVYIFYTSNADNTLEIMFNKVQFTNNMNPNDPTQATIDAAGTVCVVAKSGGDIKINMFYVNFTSNTYLGYDRGGILTVLLQNQNDSDQSHNISIKGCKFVRNRSSGHGGALYIDAKYNKGNIQIAKTTFIQNVGASIVYLHGFLVNYQLVKIYDLNFTNNTGSAMYLSSCNVKLSGILLFKNNIAMNGGAMYIEQETTVSFDDRAIVHFIANRAQLYGGAIYVDLECVHHLNQYFHSIDSYIFSISNSSVIMFINNSASTGYNSMYFDVPIHSHISCTNLNKNISDSLCILHIPCQFNYSQPVNGKMTTHISCDLDYALLNGTGAPIVTSPHELRLYFPFSDGYKISSTSHNYVYFVRNNILGYPVKFTGAVFDYFMKPTISVLFNIQLNCSQNAEYSAYALMGVNSDHILSYYIDNFTIANVIFKGNRIDFTYINCTLILQSPLYMYSFYNINATLIVELVPCIDHPGYTYSEESETCVCYHHNVKCSDDGNEIKRGYWFGSIASKATTSLCPNHYCEFTDQKQTSEGYFELPNKINAQCNDHRVGRACGECRSGYTLSYDSTDCISADQCGTGWTALVITLTCLYWIAVVAGVFSLMYFRSQISLGYLYGLIYYYSMVGILLNNNPYVSDGAFQFASILSSFAQLTPQFLGKLCLMKSLSGIDQLFIHYSHAVGVSLLLLSIVIAVRYSARLSLFVRRCIICVICLLILLSYTSIASTSLQLLLPLKFTDVKEWYTYSSPSIQYFRGRHIIYGAVAVICELVVGIGLPLLLLLEPILNKRINFIKIKPLLDQLQGCYKDKYRCFAAYYLICRQVIFLIVYIFNSNYSNMLFYLQTACVVIVMIHIWIQPYQNEFLNAFDGVMLLSIVLEVNINTFPFLNSMTTEVSIVIVMLPLLLLSSVVIKKVFHFYLMRWRCYHYTPINDFVSDERVSDVAIRYVHICSYMIYS